MLTIIVLPVAILLYLVVSFTHNYFRLPGSFKGPLFAFISEWWLAYQAITANLHHVQIDLLKKHASKTGGINVSRIGPNLLVTDDPGLLRHMSVPKSRWTRSQFHDAFDFGGFTQTKHVFMERDETKHRDLRAKLGPGYSGRGVDNLEATIDAQILNLIRLLKESYARPRKVFDFTRISSWFTIDVLSAIAFDNCVGFLSANEDKWSYVQSNEAFFPILQLAENHFWVRAFLRNPLTQGLLSPKETDEVGFGRLQRFAKESIEKRFRDRDQGKEEKRDMLGSFIAHGLTMDQCKAESLVQIIAGSDSTASTIRMAMVYIVSNPRIYNALRKEVDGVRVSREEVITDLDARRLPYLQAVIWESLRKTPPLFGLISKVAPPEGERVGDVFFPGGCEVAVCLQAVTHKKEVFGEDVNVFRPERWLEVDREKRMELERTTELVFGSGRFGCLGRGIAWVELGKVFFELTRRFDWEIVDPLKPVRESKAHAIWIHKGMDMIVTERIEV